MTACLPRCRVHNYCAVKSDVIGIFNHKFLPPSLLDVVFELNAERAVVPRVGKTAVDFTSGIDESAVFARATSLSIVSCAIKLSPFALIRMMSR